MMKLFALSDYSRALLGGYLVTFIILFASILVSHLVWVYGVIK